jgi:hypothetical protein
LSAPPTPPPASRGQQQQALGERPTRAREETSGLKAEKKKGALQASREGQPSSTAASASRAAGAEVAPEPPATPQRPVKAAAPNMAAPEPAQLDAAGNAAIASQPGAKQTVTAQAESAPNVIAGLPRAQASSEARPALRKEQAFALAAPVQKVPSVLKAPSGSTLWRAGLSGKIERSTDGGATWSQQASPSQVDWLAGAAVSNIVCWLVGRRGVIARTINGQHWDIVASPPTAAGADGAPPDWTSIVASDSQTVTITASDGRKFSTADGGNTWQAQSIK